MEPGQLLSMWTRFSRLPGGKWVFSRLLGWTVPYTGTIRPRVEELQPGFVRVSMADRRTIRNHLRSVHAIALANLGELATGLATQSSLPATARSILVRLSVEYIKKARGRLVAECVSDPPPVGAEPVDHEVQAIIRDEAGDEVTRVTAVWRLAPRK